MANDRNLRIEPKTDPAVPPSEAVTPEGPGAPGLVRAASDQPRRGPLAGTASGAHRPDDSTAANPAAPAVGPVVPTLDRLNDLCAYVLTEQWRKYEFRDPNTKVREVGIAAKDGIVVRLHNEFYRDLIMAAVNALPALLAIVRTAQKRHSRALCSCEQSFVGPDVVDPICASLLELKEAEEILPK